jgi:hypothetical protein
LWRCIHAELHIAWRFVAIRLTNGRAQAYNGVNARPHHGGPAVAHNKEKI